MAPKGIKRPAAAATPAAKKSKLDKELKAKSSAVEAAITSYEGLPESVRKMLAGSLKSTLFTLKEERHPVQINMVEMVAEAMSDIEESYKKEIATLQEKVDGADAEKAALTQGEVDAQAELDKLKALTQEASAASATASNDVKVAKTALAQATAAQKEGDASFKKQEEDKAKLESQLNGVLVPLKEASATTLFAKETNHKLKEFSKVCKEFTFEASLIDVAMAMLPKEAADRGTFEVMVYKQLEEAFTTKIDALAKELEAHAPGKTERADLVASKEAELATAQAKSKEAEEAMTTALSNDAEAIKVLAAKSKALKNFMPEMKKASNSLDKAKAALEDFKTGALQGFLDLKELAPPPPTPEPEPAPAETAAAEAEPETKPMEEEAAAPAEVAAAADAAPADAAPAESAPADVTQ